MTRFPKKLADKMDLRYAQNTFRQLQEETNLVDFFSNDYLGLSRSKNVYQNASELLRKYDVSYNGATGSRLLSGNHPLYSQLEERISKLHQTECALVFNSGYDANIGFFGAVPQRGDVVFYDEVIHASIRDGIKMGNAKSYKFKHNDVEDLKKRCRSVLHRNSAIRSLAKDASVQEKTPEVYVVTESVFSMDGDRPDLKSFVGFCNEMNYHLVVDEAHAIGVIGQNGQGLVQQLKLQNSIFARIITFGKAIGCHGAAILGSKSLKNYLVNFSRSFIYTTGLPPHSIATIMASYEYLSRSDNNGHPNTDIGLTSQLLKNIELFNLRVTELDLEHFFIPSTSAIHCCILPGNEKVRAVSETLRKEGFEVRAILYPTIPKGQERLRICLHSFNTKKEIHRLLKILSLCIEN